MRRLTSFVLAATLLYVNVERVNIFCARHSAVTAEHSGDVAPDDSAPHANGHHAPPQPNGQQEHGESPVQLDCCLHMATCAMMLALRTDHPDSGATPRGGEIWIGRQHEPTAWDTAPPAPPPWA